ncbi:MAG: hypothetical protein AAGJ82_02805 [Bacteroidota bacterium]
MDSKYIFGVLILLLLTQALAGQEQWVFPGDANVNGIVDHYDLLPTGYAFGQVGPSRNVIDHMTPEAILAPWSDNFPDGTNFIHADANANGIVELLDLIMVSQNRGLGTGSITPLDFPVGIPDVDPSLRLNNSQTVTISEDNVTLTLDLTVDSPDPQQAFNGIAFDIVYDPTYVTDVELDLAADWLTADGAAFQFVVPTPGLIQVGLTRYGSDPVVGSGPLGTLNLVIIDDLIALLETVPDTNFAPLRIRNIQSFDGDFLPVPIADDSLRVRPLTTETVTSIEQKTAPNIRVYPNPSTDFFTVQAAELRIQRAVLYDPWGRPLELYRGAPTTQLNLAFPPHLPPAVYRLLLLTADGRTRVLTITHY